MRELIFDTKLLNDGHLYCPKKFAIKNAKFKVIVSVSEDHATDSEIEMSSIIDNSNDFLTKKEIKYYLNLDEK